MKMAITLETIHKEIQQVRTQLHRLLDDEGNLSEEARLEIKKAREEMAHGEFISHEEIKAKYG